MPKKKRQRFAELETLERVFQPKGLFLEEDFELKGKWNSRVFHNQHPLIVELGCGRGEYTIGMARMFPEKNFIGMDIKGARLWRGAKTANEDQIANASFLRFQIERLEAFFAPGEIDEIWITFPDPQPQKTRENRRMTSPRFLKMYRSLLGKNGKVHLKTDNVGLYEYTLEILAGEKVDMHQSTNDLYNNMPADPVLEIKTTYESRFLAQGMKICYLSFAFR